MTTTVVYASGESGYVQCSSATYLTAARGDGTLSATVSATIARVGQRDNGSTHYCFELALKWDTSAVGTDTVSNVDFEVDGSTDASTTEFILEGYEYDWGTTLENADFRDSDAGIPALGSIISSFDTSGGFATGTGYLNDLGANAAFASAINGSGDTRIVVVSSRHRTETEVTGDEYVDMECTGNTNDARLTITHSPLAARASSPMRGLGRGAMSAPTRQHWHSIDTLNSGLVAAQASPASYQWTADMALYAPLMVRDTITVHKVWVACGSSGSGNLDIGLYDVDGTRLISSGSQSHPASATEFVYDVADTVISPGTYYFALSSDSGSDYFYLTLVSGPLATAFGIWYQASAFALPSSATFASGAAFMPIGGILTNTVVS